MTQLKISEQEVSKLPTEWSYRLLGNLLILSLIFSISSIIVTLKNDLVNKQINEFMDYAYKESIKYGLHIDDVLISGRQQTTQEDIINAIELDHNINILSLDLFEIKEKIEQLAWVKKANVRRSLLPNIIHIDIEEKKVSSIWQIHEKFHPIDFDGNVINSTYFSNKPTLLIVGKSAPENVKELITNIKNTDLSYYKRIKVANFISERRWNIILDDIENGITIKLPEKNLKTAWEKLLKLNETKNILKRKLTIIDLRLPNKIIVKLKKSSKNKKPKFNLKKTSNI